MREVGAYLQGGGDEAVVVDMCGCEFCSFLHYALHGRGAEIEFGHGWRVSKGDKIRKDE